MQWFVNLIIFSLKSVFSSFLLGKIKSPRLKLRSNDEASYQIDNQSKKLTVHHEDDDPFTYDGVDSDIVNIATVFKKEVKKHKRNNLPINIFVQSPGEFGDETTNSGSPQQSSESTTTLGTGPILYYILFGVGFCLICCVASTIYYLFKKRKEERRVYRRVQNSYSQLRHESNVFSGNYKRKIKHKKSRYTGWKKKRKSPSPTNKKPTHSWAPPISKHNYAYAPMTSEKNPHPYSPHSYSAPGQVPFIFHGTHNHVSRSHTPGSHTPGSHVAHGQTPFMIAPVPDKIRSRPK